ncbi:hypothetical protein HID58_049570, partial [Brassica napus]
MLQITGKNRYQKLSHHCVKVKTRHNWGKKIEGGSKGFRLNRPRKLVLKALVLPRRFFSIYTRIADKMNREGFYSNLILSSHWGFPIVSENKLRKMWWIVHGRKNKRNLHRDFENKSICDLGKDLEEILKGRLETIEEEPEAEEREWLGESHKPMLVKAKMKVEKGKAIVKAKVKSGSGKSTVDVGTADDLIPPYDALKIDALSEQEQDEEDRIGDADMNDIPVGNELMIMEEDDFLREELNQTENQEPFEQDISQPVFASEHGNSILLIEAKENSGDDGAGDDYAKAITRSATRSLFSSSQAVSRRASTRINAQTTSGH